MISVFTWLLYVAAAQKTPLFSDERYYVYQEVNSCALYADYPNGDMLRLSYKGSTETVYFTLYSDKFKRMQVDGETFTINIGSEDDPDSNLGLTAFIVQNDKQKGLNTSTGTSLLDYLQGTTKVTIWGTGLMRIAEFGTPEIDTALKRLKACGSEK